MGNKFMNKFWEMIGVDPEDEDRYDFDDPSLLVDLTERNSRNDNGVSFNRAKGEIREGMLVVTSDGVNAHGNYDPQIKFEGLDLEKCFVLV